MRSSEQKGQEIPEDESVPVTLARRLVYLAAERTLMAWIRTSLSLMALGFVIDRFGLVLRQALPHVGTRWYPSAFSFWAGTGLVVIGVMMALVAAARYLRFSLAYHREESTRPRHGVLVGALFSLVVALLGAAIAFYLITFTD